MALESYKKFNFEVDIEVSSSMEDGGVNKTVINCRQNQLGQNGRHSSSFNVFSFKFLTYKKLMYLTLNLRPCGTHG